MTLITPKEVTNWFLYGQPTRPSNLVSDALIRPKVTEEDIRNGNIKSPIQV